MNRRLGGQLTCCFGVLQLRVTERRPDRRDDGRKSLGGAAARRRNGAGGSVGAGFSLGTAAGRWGRSSEWPPIDAASDMGSGKQTSEEDRGRTEGRKLLPC